MSGQQLHLFEAHAWRPAAVAVSTSIAAAEAVAEAAPIQREAVFRFLQDRGPAGATRNEISEGLGIKLQSVCGRCNELLRAERIYQSDETRKTSSAGSGKVLRVR